MALLTEPKVVNNACFKYPLLHLISKTNKKLTSASPLRWTTEKDGLTHHPIKQKLWHKGEPLEGCIKTAFQRLSFCKATTPENLDHKEVYKNCNYQQNGYGADFITHNTLIEAKLRSSYLTPKDFYLNALPRFLDLDPYHRMNWLLILWGRISLHTRAIIKQHGIKLIVIPFAIDNRTFPSKTLRHKATAYIAEQLKLMALFTIVSKPLVGDVGCCVGYEYSFYLKEFYQSYQDYFSSSSSDFSHNFGGHHRRWAIEMQQYRLLTRDMENPEATKQRNVKREYRIRMGYDTPELIRQRNIWNEYQQIKQSDWLRS